jgi:plastocyanin
MRRTPLAFTRTGRRFPAVGRRWRIGLAELLAAALFLVAASAFAASLQVAQKHRQFSQSEISIQRGDTLAFSNDDEFLHQIYVDSKAMIFDSAEQAPGQTIRVVFSQPGTFRVRCHIHPKMLLTVQVK